jgi:hypothetical protein
MSTNRTNKEELAFSVGIRQSFGRWDKFALQQVEEILFSSTRLESLGNVAIDEKTLREKGQGGKVNPNQLPHFSGTIHLVVLDFDDE